VFDLRVVVPVPDMAELDAVSPAGPDRPVGPGRGNPTRRPGAEPTSPGNAAGRCARPSIWPHVEERVVDLSPSTTPRWSSLTPGGWPSG
jgi:ATP-dependent Lhr-like helicase